MMRASNIRMKTRVLRTKLLGTLRENAQRHAAIVAEAREGYRRKALEALTERRDRLRGGETVDLMFHLRPPVDHCEVYANAIAMLEWGTEEHVELEADEFRQLVRDEWDWSDDFLSSNSAYSATAMSERRKKGL